MALCERPTPAASRAPGRRSAAPRLPGTLSTNGGHYDLREIFQALPGYDFGWAGFNSTLNAAHVDTCLLNKLYEYLACGLPVLTLGHRALSRLLAERASA